MTTLASDVTTQQPYPNAIQRTQADKNTDIISVKDFGAKGDGVTDDTQAILNAINAANSKSKSLYFCAGTYLFSGGGKLLDGVIAIGDGRDATHILCISAQPTNGYLFQASGMGSGIKSIGFNSKVTQTGGSYVHLAGPESFINDFAMQGDINGILMTGNVSRIRHGRFRDGASGAIRIKAEGGDNSQLIDEILMGAQSPQVVATGIRVRNSAALIISNTSVIQQGTGLLIDPYTKDEGVSDAGGVASLWVHNCFFDNSRDNGIRIAVTGNADLVRCRFSNVWTSSSGAANGSDGFLINNTGTGTVNGIQILGSHALLNKGAGISLHGNLGDIVIDNCIIAHNSTGIWADDNITGLRITNNTIGQGGGESANTNYGIVINNSGIKRYTIINNDVTGNATAMVDKSGVQAIVKNNQNIKTQATGTATIPANASSVVVNHGLFATPIVSDIQLTQQSKGLFGLFVSNVTANTFTINTSNVSTTALNVSWEANLSKYSS